MAHPTITGLHGLRPHPDAVLSVTAPPYDVIKPGTELEALLSSRPENLWHVTLGPDPVLALKRLQDNATLVADDELCFYVYEQTVSEGSAPRVGFFAAIEMSSYAEGKVIRHERTFDDKVAGRLALARKTGLTVEPVFMLTKARITPLLKDILEKETPLFNFVSDFGCCKNNEMHGIRNRVVRVPLMTEHGKQLKKMVEEYTLYIADGHHRYHAALLGGNNACMTYIVEDAGIQAYNRVINGIKSFAEIKDQLKLEAWPRWETPPKHAFAIYHKSGTYLLRAQHIPDDVVGRLDASILERELYSKLNLDHSMIKDVKHFDYYPEQDLEKMKERVDAGDFDIAVALHPVSIDELMAVADAGLDELRQKGGDAKNVSIVMPEKSTFFAPKILSGLLLYRHQVLGEMH